MSDTAAGLAFAIGLYEKGRDSLARSVEHLVDDAPSTVARGEEIFAEIAPTLAYLDAPHNPLARALFYCAINLSLYKALAEQGIDVLAPRWIGITGIREFVAVCRGTHPGIPHARRGRLPVFRRVS